MTPLPSFLARLRRHGMVRGIAALASGQIAAQILAFAFMPLLTRLYTPDEHGLFGLFQAFVTVAYLAVTFRYDAAIASVADRAEAARLYAGAVLLMLPGTLLCGLAWLLLVGGGMPGFAEARAADAPLAALAALATALYVTSRFWLIHEGAFRVAATVQVVQSAVRGGAQTGLALAPLGGLGLVLGDVLARFAGVGRMLRQSLAGLREGFAAGRPAIRATLVRHSAFPRWGLPSALIDSTTAWLPIPLVIASFGVTAGGWLAISTRVLAAPVMLIGASTADAFVAEFARSWEADRLAARRLFRRTAGGLALLAVVLTAAVIVLAPPLFGRVFGEGWQMAGTLAALQAPWLFAGLAVSPVSRVVFVLRGQQFKFLYDLSAFGGMLGVWYWSRHAGWDLETLIGTWAALQVGLFGLYYGIMEVLIARRLRR